MNRSRMQLCNARIERALELLNFTDFQRLSIKQTKFMLFATEESPI